MPASGVSLATTSLKRWFASPDHGHWIRPVPSVLADAPEGNLRLVARHSRKVGNLYMAGGALWREVGPGGGPMKRHSERNGKIFDLKLSGLTLEELAMQFNLQPGTIKSIVYAEKYRREADLQRKARCGSGL